MHYFSKQAIYLNLIFLLVSFQKPVQVLCQSGSIKSEQRRTYELKERLVSTSFCYHLGSFLPVEFLPEKYMLTGKTNTNKLKHKHLRFQHKKKA